VIAGECEDFVFSSFFCFVPFGCLESLGPEKSTTVIKFGRED
jgi:hypothetical protein